MAVATALASKVDTLRAQLPAVHATGYFNTGSYGPMPTVAFTAAEAMARQEYERGRIEPNAHEANRERNRDVAALAAAMFDADDDEIALTNSSTAGLNIALMGMTWERGDEIVTTLEEHTSLLRPLALLTNRSGVLTRYADIGDGSGDVVAAIASKITSRTRAIALSHVLWSTGAVLPLADVAALAYEHELLVIVDGAQAAGQVPVDLHALGIDAYAMSGQKWLCGPEGTGLLYIRRDRFTDIAPTYSRYAQFDLSGYFLPAPGAARYELGEFNAPVIAGQEAALLWLRDEVGLDWAYARIAELGAAFRAQISRLPGVSVVTPAAPMGGLVNFNVAGLTPRKVAARLYERGYTIRYVESVPCTVSARASIGWWNTEEEVTGLAAAVAELARGAV
jgi:L-cysteine/cystine lyase